jgi:integrase/recombinase XerD
MSAHGTEIRTLGPGSVVRVEDMDPTHKALLMFLANKTAATRRAYEEDLKQFWQWCEAFPVTVLAVDKIHVQLYLEHLEGRGLAQATVARRFGTVRNFLKMAYAEELIGQDPTRRIQMPKVDHTKQRRTWFATVDMANVLRAAYPHPRDYALLFFMQATAMRVGEVLPLDADGIHRDPGRAWVGFIGKGAKYAEITLDYPTLTGIDRYLDGRTEGPLFVNEWGNRMTRENVQTVLDRVSRDAGVTYRVTPHGIRRTHAKTAAEQGEDLLGIAESLRHVDSRVTRQSYIGLDSGRGALTRQRVSSVYAQMSG